MRILLATILAIGILGGLRLYMTVRTNRAPAEPPPAPSFAEGRFRVELTLTFDAGPDPFALSLREAPSVLVLFQGEPVIERTDDVAAGTPLVASIEGIVQGTNELFVRVVPRQSDSVVARAVRVRLFRDETPIGETTLWSEPGEAVEGTVVVNTRTRRGSSLLRLGNPSSEAAPEQQTEQPVKP